MDGAAPALVVQRLLGEITLGQSENSGTPEGDPDLIFPALTQLPTPRMTPENPRGRLPANPGTAMPTQHEELLHVPRVIVEAQAATPTNNGEARPAPLHSHEIGKAVGIVEKRDHSWRCELTRLFDFEPEELAEVVYVILKQMLKRLTMPQLGRHQFDGHHVLLNQQVTA